MPVLMKTVVSPLYTWGNWASEKLNYLLKHSSYLLLHTYILKILVALNNNNFIYVAHNFVCQGLGAGFIKCFFCSTWHWLGLWVVAGLGWKVQYGFIHRSGTLLGVSGDWDQLGPYLSPQSFRSFPHGTPIRLVRLFIGQLRAQRESWKLPVLLKAKPEMVNGIELLLYFFGQNKV